MEKELKELDEQYIKSVFGKKQLTGTVVEKDIEEVEDKESVEPDRKKLKTNQEDDGEMVSTFINFKIT